MPQSEIEEKFQVKMKLHKWKYFETCIEICAYVSSNKLILYKKWQGCDMRAPDITILVRDSTLWRIRYSKTKARTVAVQCMDCHTCWLNGSFKDEFNSS